MRITYSFPALNSVLRRSAAQPSLHLVNGVCTTHVAELSDAEAPVAAVVEMAERDGGQNVRFYNGRFYHRTHSADPVVALGKIELVNYRAIGDRLVELRKDDAALHPRSARGAIKNIWIAARDNKGLPHTYERHRISTTVASEMAAFDPSKHDEDEFSRWRTYAGELASSLIIVDGEFWHPIDEPMLAKISMRANSWTYEDAAVYRSRGGRSKDMPKPYGRGPTLYPGMGRGPRYWNADFKFVSLPEAENTSDAKTGWVFEVLMPEAFTNDVLYLELDRAARLAVAAMTDAVACSELDSFIRRDEELAWHRKILLNLTKRSSLPATSEELEVALSSFSKYIAAGSRDRKSVV